MVSRFLPPDMMSHCPIWNRGAPPEQAAIGIILSESMRYLSAGMWWSAVLPGLTLVALVLLADKLADHLRTLIDPYTAQE